MEQRSDSLQDPAATSGSKAPHSHKFPLILRLFPNIYKPD